MSSYVDRRRDYAIITPGPLSDWQGGGPNITPNQSGYPATLTWPHSLVSLQRTHNSSDVSSICQSETGRWRRPPDERRSLPRHQRRPSSLSYSTRHFTHAPCGEAMWSRGGQVPDCHSHVTPRRRVLLGLVTPILLSPRRWWTTVFEVRRRPQ